MHQGVPGEARGPAAVLALCERPRPFGAFGPPARLWRRVQGLLFALGLVCLCACQTDRAWKPVNRVEPEASAAYERAREHWRRGTLAATAEARLAAQRAVDLAPGWVAPRRFLDELARADLLGVQALARHRAELAENPMDPGVCYLAGRLEGRSGAWRFERAVQLDPTLAWAWHGLAWAAAADGDPATAIRHGQRAVQYARDAFEYGYFQSGLARIEFSRGKPREALARLMPLLDSPEIAPVDRVELAVQAAQIELSMFFQAEGRRGEQRALKLLREEDLTDAEVEALLARLRFLRIGDGSGTLELQLALASRRTPARDRLRAELMLEERPSPLALGLLARSSKPRSGRLASGPLLRAARFAAGQFELGVEEWLADLPAPVLDERGMPRDLRLSALVESARSLGDAAPRPVATGEGGGSRVAARTLSSFGDSLIAAGWFREARAVAGALAAHDLDSALELEDRAATGQQLLAAVRRLLVTTDHSPFAAGSQTGDAPSRFRPMERGLPDELQDAHVDELLQALSQLVARAEALWERSRAPEKLARDLAREFEESPRYRYGFLGQLVHPGPRFSKEDERQGLGKEGEIVPGFARAMARIGRFALLGEMLGGDGPDATVLSATLVETRRGEHLGTPWSGTVAWCEGSDVLPKAAREGAVISGAALHEGYWIDIDAVRRERDVWTRLAREFAGAENRERREAALASRGLSIVAPATRPDLVELERRSVQALLGEADRMRLSVIAEREAQGREVSLDELVELTAIHEEGHLCDRTRLLPISEHPLRAAALFAGSGFSPRRVAERLEYRAQLTALCAAPDPRLGWVDVLGAGEGELQGVTAHADAYRRLLADLVRTLDQMQLADPGRFPELDPRHVLAHQLHLLPPESLRRVALELARREGLLED